MVKRWADVFFGSSWIDWKSWCLCCFNAAVPFPNSAFLLSHWRIQGGRSRHAPPPPTVQNFLNFMQFLGNFEKNCVSATLLRVGALSYENPGSAPVTPFLVFVHTASKELNWIRYARDLSFSGEWWKSVRTNVNNINDLTIPYPKAAHTLPENRKRNIRKSYPKVENESQQISKKEFCVCEKSTAKY